MRGRGLRWLGYTVALVSVVLAVVLASRFGTDPGLVPSPLIGREAPEFSLATLDGTAEVALSDLRGDIVVVNFAASWCLECRLEHEHLVATSNAFGGQGVTFVQIAYHESPTAFRAWLDDVGTSEWTHYLQDPRSTTAIAFGVFGIPETYFIDETGIVVGKIIGEANSLILGATIDAIKRGERPGQSVTGDTQQRPD